VHIKLCPVSPARATMPKDKSEKKEKKAKDVLEADDIEMVDADQLKVCINDYTQASRQ
jgi:hypothetical protein